MAKKLPVSVIQKSIVDQLEASREIFAVIPSLADVIEDIKNERQRQALATAMHKLVDIGEKLSKAASETGEKLVQLEIGEGKE